MKRFVLRVRVFLGLCAISLGLKLIPTRHGYLVPKHEMKVLLWKLKMMRSSEKASEQLDQILGKEDDRNG